MSCGEPRETVKKMPPISRSAGTSLRSESLLPELFVDTFTGRCDNLNLLFNSTAKQISTYWTDGASFAVDGNKATYQTTRSSDPSGNTNPWLAIDLGQVPKFVNYIVITTLPSSGQCLINAAALLQYFQVHTLLG